MVVVLNNNAYGMIAWKAHQMGMDDFGLGPGPRPRRHIAKCSVCIVVPGMRLTNQLTN